MGKYRKYEDFTQYREDGVWLECAKCHEWKTEDDYAIQSEARSGRQTYCRECSNELRQAHRDALPEMYHKGRATAMRKSRARKEWLVDIKGGACELCGLKYPKDLDLCSFDFHHRDPELKRFGLSSANMGSRSLQAIEEEALRCVLVCANCHRALHYSSDLKAHFDERIAALEEGDDEMD